MSLAALYDRGHRQVPIEPNGGQHLDVDMSLRVNVGFFEVIGEDNVMTGPFPD